ncbi:P-loop NTPase fold protein [Aquibium sp. ELW1220]|uniref:KAP family P-loop NTPase fold protein n=1 Tax=Aquibium sp. ELW1220 TaxID=2976766 RepID=UPI0025AF0360|nr:P-loop NTPase fold protein [Aquibium sp. ELW1220]MDN2580730.1 KAP family NTPase [Aquibium sp. ELW1220]
MAQELDRPIARKEDDRLGRGLFVQQLTDALIDKTTGKSSGLVVSLLGAWGSGKSSILNLLELEITSRYAHAKVLRFDPWLIANRDSLIRQFLSDLGTILTRDAGAAHRAAKKAGKLLSEYDDVINVGIDAVGLLSIPFLTGGLKATKSALKKKEKTLHQLKAEINSAIMEIKHPIIILIDEVDRLEDGEVLEIMRLVKAVADFPNVSYMLAYDVDRVVEALGANARSAEDPNHRGRAYLEKVVQHQVFLPALFEAELIELFRTELKVIVGDVEFPDSRYSDNRYSEVENAIFPSLIRTPRDLKRCIGIFRALFLMVGGEVSWMDLLGYAALLTKAPSLTERIKSDPIFFSSDFGRGGASYLRYGVNAPKPAEQLSDVLGHDYTRKRPEAKLVQVLFPRFGETERKDEDHTRIEHFRALSFLIRQGTPPGALPLRGVRDAFQLCHQELVAYFDESVRAGHFDDLNYILSYHYGNFADRDHVKFWMAMADWCRKPDHTIPVSHDPRIGYLELVESSFRMALYSCPNLARLIHDGVFARLADVA